ncbi:hypothetical protein Tco_0095651, partial [Tanacetum coccineum]
MGLLDFVKCVDPFKVKTGERTLAENEVSLSREIEDKVISPSRETLHLVDHTIVDELESVAGKKKRKIAFNDGPPLVKKAKAYASVAPLEWDPTTASKTKLGIQSGQQGSGSGPTTAAMDDFVSSSVTLTLEHRYEDESADNVRTRPTSQSLCGFDIQF